MAALSGRWVLKQAAAVCYAVAKLITVFAVLEAHFAVNCTTSQFNYLPICYLALINRYLWLWIHLATQVW